MASFNRVILVGNVTRDPDLRYVGNNTAVTELGLAVNDRRKNAAGEWVEETTFVDVTLWARTAEVASEYLSKGSKVYIEGRIQTRQWDDKDGNKRYTTEIVAREMKILTPKGGGSVDAGYEEPPMPEPSMGDDVPF